MAGLLLAAVGVGAVVGSVAIHRFLAAGRLSLPLATAALAVAVPFAVLAVADRLPLDLLMFAAVGFGDRILRLTGSLAIQRMAPRNLLVRLFGINEALQMGGMALGALLVPLAVQNLQFDVALVCIGGGVLLVAGGLVLGVRRRLDKIEPPPAEVIERLLADPLFAHCDVLQVEALAAGADRRSIPSDVTVTRQGDTGTEYFVIVGGEVRVSIDGERVREMGAGESFGEIALLRDTVRTATVRTTQQVEVLVIDREAFLEAVTGHPQSLQTADVIVDRWLG